jgi:hypothetical protein
LMKIEILVGMIASSKTTHAKSRADDGALIVSHDDLTEMLHGRYTYHGSLRECYRDMEEALVKVAIREGHDVVIDRTHLTHESRKRWINFVRDHRIKFGPGRTIELVAVVFRIEAAKVHALRRFEADPRGRSYEEWLGVAKHHFEQAMSSPMSEGSGFDRVEWKEFVAGEVRESTRDRVMSRIDATDEVRTEKSMAAMEEMARLDAKIARERPAPMVATPRPAETKPRTIKLKPIPAPKVVPVVPEPKNSFDLNSLRESLAKSPEIDIQS